MVERITLAQQHAVNEQRRMGRTDRQAEKIVGLPNGILSRRYLVDDSAERDRARYEKAVAEWREKDDRFQRAVWGRDDRTVVHGWRPDGDCISTRPDPKSTRPTSRRKDRQHG